MADLRTDGVSWFAAYSEFTSTAHPRMKKLIDNMQVLHECRDSRDDHFAKRNTERRIQSRRSGDNQDNDGNEDNDLDMTEMLSHLEDIEKSWSEKNSKRSLTVTECLQHARECGLITEDRCPDVEPDMSSLHEHKVQVDNTMEHEWEDAYANRRRQQKSPEKCVKKVFPNTSTIPSRYVDGQEYTGLPLASTCIQRTILSEEAGVTIVNPDQVSEHWNLNPKQRITYKLIIDQCLNRTREPFSMILTGTAGTGKSRIIHATQDFLARRNESYRFRLASYTGIAAQNIDGVTLHSALGLSALRAGKLPVKTRQNLIDKWSDVDFLFIDEYSMIGCRMLYKIHLALTIAKECSKPFGGINIIFAGDFCQLPVVGETRLYAKFGSRRLNELHNLDAMYGKLLWLSIRNVIVLQTVERQRGSGSTEIILLLSHLREGKCTTDDYDFVWPFGKGTFCDR